MAIPPEPIQELLPQATLIVEAQVSEVISTDAFPPQPKAKPGATSVPGKTPKQVVKLKITRVIKGNASGEITVTKPEGHYMLSVGNKGPFLLKDDQPNPVIIGRYGPDTYTVQSIEHTLKQLAK
ncbi:MAG: hypothetical protein AB2A00_21260 [Myxococcota bacterium]